MRSQRKRQGSTHRASTRARRQISPAIIRVPGSNWDCNLQTQQKQKETLHRSVAPLYTKTKMSMGRPATTPCRARRLSAEETRPYPSSLDPGGPQTKKHRSGTTLAAYCDGSAFANLRRFSKDAGASNGLTLGPCSSVKCLARVERLGCTPLFAKANSCERFHVAQDACCSASLQSVFGAGLGD